MKTIAAVGLLLFSGILVVSGAMMGTVAAQQEKDPAESPRALGPTEVHVVFQGPDGQPWPRERVTDPSILVEANALPREEGARLGERTQDRVDERLSTQIDLEWVERRDGAEKGPDAPKGTDTAGQVRRNEAGYTARVIFTELKDGDDRGPRAGTGGYWRALYTPPADRRIVNFGATVVLKDDGITRTIPGFAYPHVDGGKTGRLDESRRHLEALERSIRQEAWDEARTHAAALDGSAGASEELRKLRSAIDDREKDRALDQVSALRRTLDEPRKGEAEGTVK